MGSHPQRRTGLRERIGVGIEGNLDVTWTEQFDSQAASTARHNPQTPTLAADGMTSILSAKGALRSLPRASVRQKNGIVVVTTRCNSTKTTSETTPGTLNWSQYLAIRRQRHKWETVRTSQYFIARRLIECSCRSHLFRRLWSDSKELSHTSRRRPSISQPQSWCSVLLPGPFTFNLIVCRVLIP